MKTNENLVWKQQISELAIKLNRENTIYSTLRHLMDSLTLKPKIIQYLNPIYIFPFWFEQKHLIKYKDILFRQRK